MKYISQNCDFDLPEVDIKQTSVTIVKIEEKSITLVITRAPFDQKSFEESFDFQIGKIKEKLKQYKIHEKNIVALPNGLRGIELRNEFIQGSERIHQLQFACQLGEKKEMVVIVFAKNTGYSEEDEIIWDNLKNSLIVKSD